MKRAPHTGIDTYRLVLTIALSLCMVVWTGCAEDDDDEDFQYPDMMTELAEAFTNSSGNVSRILFDSGTEYTPAHNISTNVKDTLFRCVCSYVYDKGSKKINVYNIEGILSAIPRPTDPADEHPTDEVKLLSHWRSQRYLNAYISYKTTDKDKHGFGFSEDEVKHYEDGHTATFVTLLHKRPANDSESYTKRIYVSLPLYYYQGKTDTVHLNISGTDISAIP